MSQCVHMEMVHAVVESMDIVEQIADLLYSFSAPEAFAGDVWVEPDRYAEVEAESPA